MHGGQCSLTAQLYLISPTAVGYLPVLVLHAVSLGYLLLQRQKPVQTWLFCGWLGGMALMAATQCAAHVIYAPLSGYLDWAGGLVFAGLSLVSWLQFAYHYPRLSYPREARLVLAISLLVTAGLFGLAAREAIAEPARYQPLYDTRPADAEATLSQPPPNEAWIQYVFEHHKAAFAGTDDRRFWLSYKVLNLWLVVAHAWVLSVWLRKTVLLAAQDPLPGPGKRKRWRRWLAAVTRPQGKEARRCRVWVLLMLLAPLPLLSLLLEPAGLLPPGSFAAAQLAAFATIVIVYVNYTPQPTTFMVKLVGISLATILAMLGLSNQLVLSAQQRDYFETRRAEVAHVQALVRDGTLEAAAVPPAVQYVAARSPGGLFANDYQVLFARQGAADAHRLAAQDAFLGAALARGDPRAVSTVAHEHPWLDADLSQDVGGWTSVKWPPASPSYRGILARPGRHFVRFAFVSEGRQYEVGFDYLDYRRSLHRRALPLLALTCGAALLILFAFPLFFKVGLANPLHRLLDGVTRVKRGDLRGSVPVEVEDEIGLLTEAFNRMVSSLRESEARVQALNVSLEQRVDDRTRDLATLYRVASLTANTLQLDTLLAAALHSVVEAVGAAAGAVLLGEQDGEGLRLAVHYGLSPEAQAEAGASPAWSLVCERGEPLLVHDLAADARAGALFSSPWPYPTLLAVPIHHKDRIVGVLSVFGGAAPLFNVEDVGLLIAVAEQMATAVENADLRRRAKAAAVVEERQRLARDLHDSVTQLLYSQTLLADVGQKHLKAGQPEQALEHLQQVGEAAAQALREMRLLIYRLRPGLLAAEGLVGALQRRLELVEQRAGIQACLQVQEVAGLSPALEGCLFYVAEEALNNALKHARATTVLVRLHLADVRVELAIEDDGRGFDARTVSEGLGLAGMRERVLACAGSLEIQTRTGEGTRVVASLPLPGEADRHGAPGGP